MNSTLEVTEIIRKLDQGKTQPYLCSAADHSLYVVKGRSALSNGCINEVICATLGQKFGLPVPNHQLLVMPEGFLEGDGQLLMDLGYGTLFGSEFHPHLEEFNREIAKEIDEQLLRDLFIFDYWMKNEDRTFTPHGGNPNLFYRHADKSAYVVDHNLAFDPTFDLHSFQKLHLGSNAWYRQELAEASIPYYKEKMDCAIELFEGCCNNLPADWIISLPLESMWLETRLDILTRYRSDNFWDSIK